MPALPTFTPLSDTDLAALFDGDAEGLRRYWLLHAVLAEDPNAGGDRLWRRALEILGDDETKLSRRTAYRILAQLRSDREDPPDSLRGAVKSALPLLAEDPPLTLGNSTLAQRFLPADLEQLPRGLLLQDALRTALDQLRPAGPISTIERSWWPYLICTGEYETGQTRTELQNDLALSASTYSRAKRMGLDRITGTLPQIIERMIESPALLASQQLPRTPDFVGRRDEQSYYSWRLQTDGVAHIWGLPGSGKTALAAELAAEGHRFGQTIVWHTCRPGRDSGLLGIIRGLAQALAGAGDETLWRELRARPLDEQDPAALLETLRGQLLARRTVVVLDDVQRADPEEISALLDALADLVVRRSSRLLLVGRDPIESLPFPPLPGLIESEAELLWSGAPMLPTEQWQLLYAATGGMPEPIRRVVALYRRNGDLARPNDWVDEVASWAQEAIWSRLDEPSQQLLAAAYAIEERDWGEQSALVREALEIETATLNDLRLRDLLHIAGPNVTIYGAIRSHAATRLREDAELRERVAALTSDLDAAPPPLPAEQPQAEPAEAEQSLAVGSAPSPGMDLLARIHSALQGSAEILQALSGAEARQLAEELAALQAALPKIGGPRRPFVPRLAPATAR